VSKTGIPSSRGDGYEILVAFEWALCVLAEPEFEWLEIESFTSHVDELVAGKTDGSKIFCPCKKNQPAFHAWSMKELAGDLSKAGQALSQNPKTSVRFCSRSPFGEVHALREHAAGHADELSFHNSLNNRQQETLSRLKALLEKQTPGLSTYEFLSRTSFVIHREVEHMKAELYERLRQLSTNASAVFDALWIRLERLRARLHPPTSPSRLSKDELKNLVRDAGGMLAPAMKLSELFNAFENTSAIGRTWRQEIGNERLERPVLGQLLKAIEEKKRSILLQGAPGSGKTCLLLSLQEELEKRAKEHSALCPLFLQLREVAGKTTAQAHQALGLAEPWVESLARIADDRQVVVLVDSLSMAHEHTVLSQVDRLLSIPNVTVVTACREGRYDRKISQRTWEAEFSCQPLDWEVEVVPLLTRHGMDTATIDATTQKLICNPRELDLFVGLAQQGKSFNATSRQALAQHWLESIVHSTSTLGNFAMQTLEQMAAEMLKQRSWAVPKQQFFALHDIQPLLSHNILHETPEGQLTFGDPTLLDVLMLRKARREGLTLDAFIQSLPPGPFAHSTLLRFVEQLKSEDSSEFSKQLLTVLSGNHAFHIRRLIAECLAEHLPHEEDWPFMRDLRNKHRPVFDVLYTQATHVEWHLFWLKHLVPMLKEAREWDGLTTHAQHVALWVNEAPQSVLSFWLDVLSTDGFDKTQIANDMALSLSEVSDEHIPLFAPLVVELLNFPLEEHSRLGHALARCWASGGLDDKVLWRYVIHDAKPHAPKLRCEFGEGNEHFLSERMQQSTDLLSLAVSFLEQWSQNQPPSPVSNCFLDKSSYTRTRSPADLGPGNEGILLDAMESAIVQHAKEHSTWWSDTRERLCFSAEVTLRYFAIRACTQAPTENLELIARMLCEKPWLESELRFELGSLMEAAFVQLPKKAKKAIEETLLNLFQEEVSGPNVPAWMLTERVRKQSQLLACIPRPLRSPKAIELVNEYENRIPHFRRQPRLVAVPEGSVGAPFSFQVFLDAKNRKICRLLMQYAGNPGEDFLAGEEKAVGGQLREATSRHPNRFLTLLSMHWAELGGRFCDDIVEGVAEYLAYKHGTSQPASHWLPLENIDATLLAQKILDELEKHPKHWRHNRSAAKALQSCALVVQSKKDAERVVFLALAFATSDETERRGMDAHFLEAQSHATEALMSIAHRFLETEDKWPEVLIPALRQFAADKHLAVRALLLRRLPHVQHLWPEFGWDLFALAFQKNATELWEEAEACLRYVPYETAAPWLARLAHEGKGKALQAWGRLSALAALQQHIDAPALLKELKSLNDKEAWEGAASVWSFPGNWPQYRKQCLAGLKAGLSAKNQHALAVAHPLSKLFLEETSPPLPQELLRRYFTLLQSDSALSPHNLWAWIKGVSCQNPSFALEVAEEFVQTPGAALPLRCHPLPPLLARLWVYAEEQEASDGGATVQRVVALQDSLRAGAPLSQNSNI